MIESSSQAVHTAVGALGFAQGRALGAKNIDESMGPEKSILKHRISKELSIRQTSETVVVESCASQIGDAHFSHIFPRESGFRGPGFRNNCSLDTEFRSQDSQSVEKFQGIGMVVFGT